MKALLFPLPGLILNPMSKLTLNIFEPRYLEMIDKAVSEDIPLAISPSYEDISGEEVVRIEHESTPFVYKFCGHGRVQVLGVTPEGNKLIMIEGAGKGEITSVMSGGNYNEVLLQDVQQDHGLSESSTFVYRRLRRLTEENLLNHLGKKREVSTIMGHLEDPQSLVAFYCDHILKDFNKRLEVFNANTLEEKVLLLGRFLVHH
jgi:ATP-dependent Lon protease